MAIGTYNDVLTIGRVASANIAALVACKVHTTAGQIALAGAGELPLGVVQGSPGETLASGKSVDVMVQGITRIYSGAAVTAPALVMLDSAGKAIPISAGAGNKNILGMALTSAGAGDVVIEVLLQPSETYRAS